MVYYEIKHVKIENQFRTPFDIPEAYSSALYKIKFHIYKTIRGNICDASELMLEK